MSWGFRTLLAIVLFQMVAGSIVVDKLVMPLRGTFEDVVHALERRP